MVIANKITFWQNPIFTKFYSNSIYLNPAFIGYRVCPHFALNYRKGWPNISRKFITTAANYDQKGRSLFVGLRIIVLRIILKL